MRKTAIIFEHSIVGGAGSLAAVLEEENFEITRLSVPVADLERFDPLAPDLLLIMGGSVGVYQEADYPFVTRELGILKMRMAAERPTLGICLGAQLMAKALGGEVFKGGAGREIGWHDIAVRRAAKNHPVRHLDGGKTSMFHWHGDTFTLPPGATLLAASEKYPQSFSKGDKILGLQCHAEVCGEVLKEWYALLAGELTGPDAAIPLKDLKEQSARYAPTLKAQTRIFLKEWLALNGLAGCA